MGVASLLCCCFQALSDAHAFLFEERQRLLASQAENDELRLQEIEDRKRIQQLLGYNGGPSGGQQQQGFQPGLDTLMLKIESMQAQLNEQVRMQGCRQAALMTCLLTCMHHHACTVCMHD